MSDTLLDFVNEFHERCDRLGIPPGNLTARLEHLEDTITSRKVMEESWGSMNDELITAGAPILFGLEAKVEWACVKIENYRKASMNEGRSKHLAGAAYQKPDNLVLSNKVAKLEARVADLCERERANAACIVELQGSPGALSRWMGERFVLTGK